jgi:hypothetical protein
MNQLAVPTTAESRYTQLSADRSHFIERGDKCAKLTIPTLFQRDVTISTNMKIKDPEQSIGARGVNNLASKMILSLMPSNTPFFKLNLDEINPDLEDELVKEVMKGLGKIERQTLRDIENSGDVTVVFEALKHLIVVGNVLLYVGDKATRLYDLNKFTCLRSPDGEWIELVICEEVSPQAIPEAVRKALDSTPSANPATTPDKTLKLYTHVTREGGRVKWHQEVKGIKIEGTEGDVPEDGNPWLPLRFLRIDGENYGRAYVEMFLGDLNSLEVLTLAVTQGAAAAAKVIFLVKPNGTTNPKVISQAPNLSVRTGDANDVSTLRLDKAADMQVAKDMIGVIERRLAYAFMINAEVMRDAERVTAEEVRLVAQELDDSLGGIYSLMSKEFQLPYLRRRMHLMRRRKNMPKLPPSVQPTIVTGFAALGRGHDADKLMRFIEKVERLLANPAIAQKLNVDEMILRFAVADGIDTDGLVIPAPVQQQNTEQAQGMGLVEKLGPEMIRQMGPVIGEQLAMQGGMDVPQAVPAAA